MLHDPKVRTRSCGPVIDVIDCGQTLYYYHFINVYYFYLDKVYRTLHLLYGILNLNGIEVNKFL